jgi:hypothetical protein
LPTEPEKILHDSETVKILKTIGYLDLTEVANCLTVQADILLACVNDVVNREGDSIFGKALNPGDGELIADALKRLQTWKTELCKHRFWPSLIGDFSKNYTLRRRFFDKDWSRLNEEFRRLTKHA